MRVVYLSDVDPSVNLTKGMSVTKLSHCFDGVQTSILRQCVWDDLGEVL